MVSARPGPGTSCHDGPGGRRSCPHTQRAGAPSNPRSADATRGRVGCRRKHVSPASSHNARPRRGVVARIFLTRTQAQNGQVTVWAAQRGCPHPEHGLPATKQLALSHPANDENEGQGLGPPWGGSRAPKQGLRTRPERQTGSQGPTQGFQKSGNFILKSCISNFSRKARPLTTLRSQAHVVTTGRDRAVVTPVRRDTGGQSAPEPSTPHAHVATFLHLRHLPASGAPALVRAKTPPSRAMTQRQIQERKSLYEGQGQSSKHWLKV